MIRCDGDKDRCDHQQHCHYDKSDDYLFEGKIAVVLALALCAVACHKLDRASVKHQQDYGVNAYTDYRVVLFEHHGEQHYRKHYKGYDRSFEVAAAYCRSAKAFCSDKRCTAENTHIEKIAAKDITHYKVGLLYKEHRRDRGEKLRKAGYCCKDNSADERSRKVGFLVDKVNVVCQLDGEKYDAHCQRCINTYPHHSFSSVLSYW